MKKAPRRHRSVVLLSGGLDSTANLAFCVERDEPILALTVDYGQRAAESELKAAQGLASYYGVPVQRLDLKWLGSLGGSALTEAARVIPMLKTEELDTVAVTADSAKAVWVPNRNGILIHVAAAYAERMGAERVVVGFNAEEAVTFPDNSLEYLKRVSEALSLSTATGVTAFCYTIAWDKTRIVRELKGLQKRFPFELLWSCYEGGTKPCGNCESCKRLARAMIYSE